MHTNTISTSRKGEQKIRGRNQRHIRASRTRIARWKHWVQHNEWRDQNRGMWFWTSRKLRDTRRASRCTEERETRVKARTVSMAQDSQEQPWKPEETAEWASTLQGKTIPDLELNIQPPHQQSTRDEIRTFPRMWDFLLPFSQEDSSNRRVVGEVWREDLGWQLCNGPRE